MTTQTMQVSGLSDLVRALAELPGEVQAKVLRGAVSAAAEVVRAEAELRAPRYVGRVGKRHPLPGTLKASVFKARLPEECTDTREAWQVNVRRKAYYAHMVEYGTIKMGARPFMRPAWEAKQGEALETIRAKLAQAVRAATKAA